MRRSFMVLTIAGGCLSAVLLAPGVDAQTPPPTPEHTGTATSTASVPPATLVPTATGTPFVVIPTVAPTQGGFAIKVQLREDINGNQVIDSEDVAPARTMVFLLAWADPTRSIGLITGDEGSFAFTNIPPGDYDMRLYWPAGFAGDLASDALPHILQAVFRIEADGTLGVPSPLPEVWPGDPSVRFDPVGQDVLLGTVPREILLNEKDPGVLAVSPHDAATTQAVGSIDVGVAVQRGAPVRLPSTGDGGSGPGTVLLVVAGLAVTLAAAGAFSLRARRC